MEAQVITEEISLESGAEAAKISAQAVSLGKKLAVLAKLQGLTQEHIAKTCSISRISVNRFFRSHTEIRAGDLGALLDTLGIDLNQLIDNAIENQITKTAG
ncbi:MAG: helix-turn-helix transcriptional regulator [Bdellovibrionales bacterium]|jgi:transcriptional regulator with XRE-family HTH domain